MTFSHAFCIFSPRAQFLAQLFSTQKRVNRTKTDFATIQRKLQSTAKWDLDSRRRDLEGGEALSGCMEICERSYTKSTFILKAGFRGFPESADNSEFSAERLSEKAKTISLSTWQPSEFKPESADSLAFRMYVRAPMVLTRPSKINVAPWNFLIDRLMTKR